LIFVDSNVPMYLIGADHPNKASARRLLDRVLLEGGGLVTDAEVLQEILHRYVAIDRRDAIAPAFQLVLQVVEEVFPIGRVDVERARRLLETTRRLSARDAIHVAVMQRVGIDRILSFDRGLDGIPGIERVAD
jgi:predicted nucleic acid-binding protein